MEYLSVNQVAEDLQVSYQKVLYMIRTGKLPAEKAGKAFQIPANYSELMTEGKPRKKRASKKAVVKGKPGRPKKDPAKSEVQVAGQEQLINNLAKAIQDIVAFQVGAALGKQK